MGRIDQADLEMKDCSFDPGADAVKLIDWGNVFYRRGKDFFNTVFEKRERIKILKEAGLSYANVSIPYFDQNNEEQILDIVAYTYNLDESGKVKKTEVNKSSIYTKRINKQYSKMIIAFPEVKPGSVIEYKYSMQRQTMGQIKDWYFQDRIPTRYSEYQINVPAIFHFTVQPSVVDSLDVQEDVTDENIALNDGMYTVKLLKKNYSMYNLKGIRDEPFMGSANDYLQRLEFQLSQVEIADGRLQDLRKRWSDIITELMKDEDFGLKLDKRLPQADSLLDAVSHQTEMMDKMRSVFQFVRKKMKWNEEESIYSFQGASNTWNRGTGTSGDINLLLVNLLRTAGINASPILFSTRENGLLNEAFPFVNQFNTVMAYISVADKFYVLDATDKFSGMHLYPQSVVNTKGFVITGNDGKWIGVIDETHKYKMMTAVQGEIDSTGTMRGNGIVNSDEYAKKQRTNKWVNDQSAFKEIYFVKPYPAVHIENLSVSNAENDSLPLEQKVQFTYPLNHSGDYAYFSVNLFSGLDKNPFIADHRLADIDYGVLQDFSLYGSFTIPEGYIFETLPENISMITPDNDIAYFQYMQAEDNLLNVKITLNFKRNYYPASTYADFAAFYKKMMSKLNEQVVIKKKP